jgi:hypothetical protein
VTRSVRQPGADQGVAALLGVGEGQVRVDRSDPSGTLLFTLTDSASLPNVTARRASAGFVPRLSRITNVRQLLGGSGNGGWPGGWRSLPCSGQGHVRVASGRGAGVRFWLRRKRFSGS